MVAQTAAPAAIGLDAGAAIGETVSLGMAMRGQTTRAAARTPCRTRRPTNRRFAGT